MAYGRGHTTGNKRERRGAADWYAAIEAETLWQLDGDDAQTMPGVAPKSIQVPRVPPSRQPEMPSFRHNQP